MRSQKCGKCLKQQHLECGQPCEASAARDGQRRLQHRRAVLNMLASNREEEEQSQSRGSESIAWGLIEDKKGMMGKGELEGSVFPLDGLFGEAVGTFE